MRKEEMGERCSVWERRRGKKERERGEERLGVQRERGRREEMKKRVKMGKKYGKRKEMQIVDFRDIGGIFLFHDLKEQSEKSQQKKG
jgi:hypothetical protein